MRATETRVPLITGIPLNMVGSSAIYFVIDQHYYSKSLLARCISAERGILLFAHMWYEEERKSARREKGRIHNGNFQKISE
jgi:hypothetical protein